MKLNYYRDSWPLSPEVCPCDLHFVCYIKENRVQEKAIFHFGTGEHHLVGRENAKLIKPNEILGITASMKEYISYIDLIVNNPILARTYKVIFADIYTLTPKVIATFDLVTLFHLCEFYDLVNSAYAQLNDDSLLKLFLAKLNPEGKILLYGKSDGAKEAQVIVKRFMDRHELVYEGQFKSLLVYRRV